MLATSIDRCRDTLNPEYIITINIEIPKIHQVIPIEIYQHLCMCFHYKANTRRWRHLLTGDTAIHRHKMYNHP